MNVPFNTLSSQASQHQNFQPVKRRRLQGSCDQCRKKKTRCNSAEMPGNICTNCKVLGIECTHEMPRQARKTETQQAYIAILENKIRKLGNFIRRMHPGEDIDLILLMEDEDHTNNTYNADAQDIPTSFGFGDLKYLIPQSISSDAVTPPSTQDESEISDAEDLSHVALAEHLGALSLNAVDQRFYGQSSAFMFAKDASTLRSKITGDSPEPDPRKYRRPTYWDMRPWELAYSISQETSYLYPDKDLLESLVSLYFQKTNTIIPVLHKPSFMNSLTLGQHHWDPSFGMTVLLVCALGSKYSQDPRVLVPNDTSRLSAGWHYFCQVPIHRKSMLYKSSIYDLQYYVLAPLYLVGSSMPHAAWNILGIGLRYATEKGMHRRKGGNEKPSAQNELQKRVFWSLVCLDRVFNSFTGRPSGLAHETYDVEYPIECDDEYWEVEDPTKAFQQPVGKPSSITAFVCFIRLAEILGFASRTLYATKKSKILSGCVGIEWEGRMVAELDSSLNKWKQSLPNHLLWDPKRQNDEFFHQSVNLHATYYYTQIQIHRPFLTKGSPLSFSSLAMCTNAARSCTHILEASMARGIRELPNLITVAFTAGIVIVLGLWGSQQSGFIGDPDKEIQNFQKCVDVLENCEQRWNCAGRLADMLKEAGAIDQYTPKTRKRQRPSSSNEPLPPPPRLPPLSPVPLRSVVVENDGTLQFDSSTPIPINEWDLHRMLLTETGYLEGYGDEPVEPGFGTDIGGNGYANQDPATLETSNVLDQTSDFPSGNDIFALWSDVPTAFSCVEEWDAYLASVAQP